ncbi:MAG: hypothetical protein K2X93_11870 [Candidatus Obscuribacterales bacterium]|nr:hypothetical protein [Candidatus Obscuribacterales bacterium]
MSQLFDSILKERKSKPRLCLIDCTFNPADFEKLVAIKPRALNLRGCRGITDDGIRIISGIDSIEYLNLDLTKLTPAAMRSIGMMAGLKYLSLQESDITDELLKALANRRGIETVQVNRNPRVRLCRFARWLALPF